jgi:hypothetical protein
VVRTPAIAKSKDGRVRICGDTVKANITFNVADLFN